ncbi:hypothetical protein [Staphylococcus massiliensis]|uniref:Phage protein n=1 Tax=Staphylococcus massiliensis S46 TaxID=1229783 RepID=K9ADP3_9STAP|nr:hypothetical protein [Staphylococcus massiliensis]EKU45384.1 hypothetical protein C273_11286 [Staphylococcus massiliensis S46]
MNYINLEKVKIIIENDDFSNKPIAYDLLEELVFMKETLEELKLSVKEHGATYVFTQGEQSYLKENPAMKSYNTTLTKYNATYKQLLSILPEEQEEQSDFMEFVNNG